MILDDKVARREAQKLGLKVKGVLGILLKMRNEGIVDISNNEEFYDILIALDFRVGVKIFNKIFNKDL